MLRNKKKVEIKKMSEGGKTSRDKIIDGEKRKDTKEEEREACREGIQKEGKRR